MASLNFDDVIYYVIVLSPEMLSSKWHFATLDSEVNTICFPVRKCSSYKRTDEFHYNSYDILFIIYLVLGTSVFRQK